MSIEYMNAAWKLKLPFAVKYVLIALADCANQEGECFPAINYLAAKTGLTARGVQKCLNKLYDMFLVTKEEQIRKNGSNSTNKYKLINILGTYLPPEPYTPPPEQHAPTPEQCSEHITIIDPSYDPKEKDLSDFVEQRTSRQSQLQQKREAHNLETYEIFKKNYPRKEKMAKAWPIWSKLSPSDELLTIILSALAAQKKKRLNQAARSPDGWCEDWPLATSWLNAKRWEDEVYDPKVQEDIRNTARLEKMKKEINQAMESNQYGNGRC